ncbi:uncharacterized protein I206_104217 [Kwoniella pini CBS 10737]|uniref:DUF1748-domain-containing protein n=1 Tax=Kwoniella pini CBS 10737 TaxID=1296096 RepID=A0A1B9I2B1_9TREE|nr:uncharacterized protein I206_04206 [Kwoniella pini CBS 10737]OCF49683.1 hypothetical protein I206_04206 [Kwoniella pini CBS 10737]
MLGLGKVGHWMFDLIAISTIIAGVKKNTGYGFHLALIQDTAIRSFLDSYFQLGETVFGIISGYVVNSRYFKRQVE